MCTNFLHFVASVKVDLKLFPLFLPFVSSPSPILLLSTTMVTAVHYYYQYYVIGTNHGHPLQHDVEFFVRISKSIRVSPMDKMTQQPQMKAIKERHTHRQVIHTEYLVCCYCKQIQTLTIFHHSLGKMHSLSPSSQSHTN